MESSRINANELNSLLVRSVFFILLHLWKEYYDGVGWLVGKVRLLNVYYFLLFGIINYKQDIDVVEFH